MLIHFDQSHAVSQGFGLSVRGVVGIVVVIGVVVVGVVVTTGVVIGGAVVVIEGVVVVVIGRQVQHLTRIS